MLQANSSARSLISLRESLDKSLLEAAQLEESQAQHKRHQETLKQAIAVIEKNLSEFDKEGRELGGQYTQLLTQAEQRLKCIEEQLGDDLKKVQDALESLTSQIDSQEATVRACELALTGKTEIAARESMRKAKVATKQFEQLRVRELKERIKAAQDLWKEAISFPVSGRADLAVAFAMLSQVKEQLSSSTLESDFAAEKVAFAFPKDYESELVDAFHRMNQALAEGVAAQKKLVDERKTFDQGVKDLASARAAKKQTAQQAARNATTGQTCSPHPQR